MDRRDFLAGLGQATALVVAVAQGCEGEAGEPPDIARGGPSSGPLPDSWCERGTTAATFRLDHYDRWSRMLVEFREDGHADGAWPEGIVPAVERVGRSLVLSAAWTIEQGPWTGRQLRRRGDRIEQYVFGEGTWEPVGGA